MSTRGVAPQSDATMNDRELGVFENANLNMHTANAEIE